MSRTSTTLTTPAGNKVRTASRRRFVLIREGVKGDGTGYAIIDMRSDSVETLRTKMRRLGSFAGGTFVIMDARTGEVVR